MCVCEKKIQYLKKKKKKKKEEKKKKKKKNMHKAAMDLYLDSSSSLSKEESKESPISSIQAPDSTTLPRIPPIQTSESEFYNDIVSQPEAIKLSLKKRYTLNPPSILFPELGDDVLKKISDSHRVIICACGTSHNAALVGEYAIEQIARIPTKAEYASEFRYKHDHMSKEKDVFVAISQSGETADTLAALRLAKNQNVLTIGIVNEEGSAIHKEADYTILLRAGEEKGIASTKTFTASILILILFSLRLATMRGEIKDMGQALRHIENLPVLMRKVLNMTDARINHAAKVFRYSNNFLFLGRGFNFPVAMEGALKLKEISNTTC